MNEFQIVGPPGCGKTTTLSRQIEHSVDEYGFNNVLVTSLTRTAATELTYKVKDTPIHPDNIGTLHSICLRRLSAKAERNIQIANSPKYTAEWNTQHPGLARKSAGASQEEDVAGQGQTNDIWEAIELLRHRMIPESQWTSQELKVFDKWREWKQTYNVMDFTDLVEVGAEIMPDVDVIIADETQDYSALELKLLRAWGSQAEKLIMAGDPDQVLYEWRGADPDLFKSAYEGRKILSQSYRVPKSVHHKAVKWISQIKDRENFEYYPRDAEGSVKRLPFTYKSFNFDFIKDLKGTKMFLTSCGYMLPPLLVKLREAGIPFHNPFRVAQGSWNPIKMATVDRIYNFFKEEKSVEEFYKAIEFIRADEFMIRGKKTELRSRKDKKTILSDFDLFDILSDAGLGIDDVLAYFDALTPKKRNSWAFLRRIVEKNEANTLREEPEIIVGTIHSVKGAQADNVFLFPDLSMSAAENNYQIEEHNSIIRAFYVGMTRARENLFLCSPVRANRTAWN